MIIAIGGVSTAGKTTLAKQLRDYFQNKKVITLCQDDFVKPVEQLPTINGRIDWEHPDSIDHERFLHAIMAENKENDLVIAEGLLIYWFQPLCKMFDKQLFVTIDYQTFVKRKAHDNRWGHEPEWYIEHIWNSYLKFGQIAQLNSIFQIDGSRHISLQPIINYLNQ